MDPAKLCGLRLQFADSVYNLRIPLTVADSTTTNFVVDSAKLPAFGANLSKK